MYAIRPMTAADISAASAICTANGWPGMPEHFAFYMSHPLSFPFVAEAHGEIIATGVGTARGPAGWVGKISVHEQHRRQGIGEAITRHVMDRLQANGCRTLSLFASAAGRPIYERIGYVLEAEYRLMTGPTLATLPDGLEPFTAQDLPELLALDRQVTAEDRSLELQKYARQYGGWVARTGRGELTGFLLQSPWGGNAIIAATPDTGRLLLGAARALAARQGQESVTCALPESNRDGLAWLEQAGFHTARISPRLRYGEPLPWRPTAVWSRVSGAMG